MAFWKKNNKRKKELESIKNRVEGVEPPPLPPPMPGKAPKPTQGKPKTPKKKEGPGMARPPVSAPKPKTKQKEMTPKPKISIPNVSQQKMVDESGAPLFIKIEKYEGVLKELDHLKNTLQTLTRLISFHSEVEELKEDIFSKIKDNISELTDTLISMDEIFVKPERPDVSSPKKKKEDMGVEDQILDLGEELRHLKRELTKIE